MMMFNQLYLRNSDSVVGLVVEDTREGQEGYFFFLQGSKGRASWTISEHPCEEIREICGGHGYKYAWCYAGVASVYFTPMLMENV